MILQGFNAWMSNLAYNSMAGWNNFAPYCEELVGGGYYGINPLPVIFQIHNGVSNPKYQTGFFIEVGTGDTPVTYEDKALAAKCIDLTVQSVTVTDGDNNTCKKVSTSFTNNTANDITIKEIALAASGSDGSVYHYMVCLLARKVLDTPITIHPDETYNFSYAIKITEPN